MDRRKFIAGSAAATIAANSAGSAAAATDGEPLRTEVWEIGEKGDFETMRRVVRELPAPAVGNAIVKVDFSSIAGRDIAIARGWFLEDKEPTLVPLSEGVGTVVAVGAGDARIKVGDTVTCAHFARWEQGPWTPANYAVDIGNTVDGWLAQHAVLPTTGIAVLPETIDGPPAATMSGSGVTAWHALHDKAQVRSGETVLSLGTGGVSTWGLLLAKAAGARVVVTSSSDAKLDAMRKLGADITVNYRSDPDWGKTIQKLTGGVDVVLENVGRPTLDQSMYACANNARIVLIGTGPLPKQLPKMPGLYIKNLSMVAISNGSRRMLEDMARAISANDIRAAIAASFDFSDAPAAFKASTTHEKIGKVLIRHG